MIVKQSPSARCQLPGCEEQIYINPRVKEKSRFCCKEHRMAYLKQDAARGKSLRKKSESPVSPLGSMKW